MGDGIVDDNVSLALSQLQTVLKQQPQVKNYKQLRSQIIQRSDLFSINEEIVDTQKETAILEHFQKKFAADEKEQQLQLLKEKMEMSNELHDYRLAMAEVNELLQYITHRIEKEINKG